MLKRLFIVVTLAVLFSSCGSAPKQYVVDNERTWESDYDKVWSAVISFFAENNIPIKTIEKESGIIMSEGQMFPDAWIDCGSPGLFYVKGPSVGSFNVFLLKKEAGQVGIKVNCSFSCTYIATGQGADIQQTCNSTGIFESLLLEYVAQRS